MKLENIITIEDARKHGFTPVEQEGVVLYPEHLNIIDRMDAMIEETQRTLIKPSNDETTDAPQLSDKLATGFAELAATGLEGENKAYLHEAYFFLEVDGDLGKHKPEGVVLSDEAIGKIKQDADTLRPELFKEHSLLTKDYEGRTIAFRKPSEGATFGGDVTGVDKGGLARFVHVGNMIDQQVRIIRFVNNELLGPTIKSIMKRMREETGFEEDLNKYLTKTASWEEEQDPHAPLYVQMDLIADSITRQVEEEYLARYNRRVDEVLEGEVPVGITQMGETGILASPKFILDEVEGLLKGNAEKIPDRYRAVFKMLRIGMAEVTNAMQDPIMRDTYGTLNLENATNNAWNRVGQYQDKKGDSKDKFTNPPLQNATPEQYLRFLLAKIDDRVETSGLPFPADTNKEMEGIAGRIENAIEGVSALGFAKVVMGTYKNGRGERMAMVENRTKLASYRHALEEFGEKKLDDTLNAMSTYKS